MTNPYQPTLVYISSGIRRAAQGFMQQHASNLVLLGDRPFYYEKQYAGHIPWCAKVHMALKPVPRDQHYEVLSEVIGRPITSAKDLYLAEARAIWNTRGSLLNYYRQESIT